jgi:phosphatidylinositol-3,4,5-trisphosphate 3-phosphatase/dual-specificity protein phosphatase PTEN
MGWAWLIPAFHLPEPLPVSSTPDPKRTHSLHFSRSQIDFALGAGALIEEMIVRLEEVPQDEEGSPFQAEQAEEDEAEEQVKEDGEGGKAEALAAGIVGAVEGKGVEQGKDAARAEAA